MNNLQLPAYPATIMASEHNNQIGYHQIGNLEALGHDFTKLELASLMIAQGMLANSPDWSESDIAINWVAINSVKYAKAVLEEANKQPQQDV